MSCHRCACELKPARGVPADSSLTGGQSIRRQRQSAVGRGASTAVRGASPLRCGPLMLSLGYPRVRA